MEDQRWLEPMAVVFDKHGLAALKGFSVVCGDDEEEATTVSHAGRRSDEKHCLARGRRNKKGGDFGS